MGDHKEEHSSTIPPGQVKRVAIIGGGPAGIAAAKYLLAEATFTTLTIFDSRPSPGGIWLATPHLHPPSAISHSIPQPTPSHEPEPVYPNGDSWSVESPVYNSLTTNLPKQLMRFSDFAFPDSAPIMPSHSTVKAYLEEYAAEIVDQGLVRWGRRVTSVIPLSDGKGQTRWEVGSADISHPEYQDERRWKGNTVEYFDAVVVANGHYSSPFLPDIPGLAAWTSLSSSREKQTGTEEEGEREPLVIHAKSFRAPPSIPKKTLIIGAGISGMDIASLCAKAGSNVLLSSRTFQPAGSMPPIVTHPNITYVFPVASFLSPGPNTSKTEKAETQVQEDGVGRSVRFQDGSTEEGIDKVIFATGYFYDFPFFSPNVLASLGVAVRPESRSGPVNAVLGLYQHLVAREEPTLSFLGLPSRIVPFPVLEVQSAYVARLLSGRLNPPPKSSMWDWETSIIFSKLKDGDTGLKDELKALIEELAKGDRQEVNGRMARYVTADFHVLFGTDAEYINDLSNLCTAADKAWEEQTGNVVGKKAPFWDERMRWMRRVTPIIQMVVRDGEREKTRGLRQVEDVVGTWERWQDVEAGGEEAVEREKRGVWRRFGVGFGGGEREGGP